jgi:glycerophosphoryl diester phosphodiesterase
LRKRLILLPALALVAAFPAATATAGDNNSGFQTSKPAMITPLAPGSSVEPIISVGDTVRGYTFEALPDGISFTTNGRGTTDVYVNHETSLVPFPATRSDFTNAMVSHLRLNQHSAGVLKGAYVIPSSANYQRFCSNFLVGPAQGFERELIFTNEEARDIVLRDGYAWHPPSVSLTEPSAEQAGVVVAYDVKSGSYRSIYGMGRHNHENSVGVPGYGHPVVLSGDDTFDAPASQLYLYSAASGQAVWNDEGTLYALVSNNPAVNDYSDFPLAGSVSAHFVEVPRMIATGKRADGTDVISTDFGYPAPPAGVPDGPQWVLEYWSHNVVRAFQFIRIEDIAYDRTNPRIVYFADTGEPRAIPDGAGRLRRGPSGTRGAHPNGRIFKLVLNATNPLAVDSLSVLVDQDPLGYANPAAMHQPDNVETTANSLLITEDPGSHNQGAGGYAKIWRYTLPAGPLVPVAQVNQSTRPDLAPGTWESSGIIDASDAFGPGAFLVDVQAHLDEIQTAPSPFPGITYMRENGQLLVFRLPGA